MGLRCCCTSLSPKQKREIKLGCFGVDGAGKTTILKMIKGEDPRGVLPTNGFSMIDMEYDDDFNIKVYDLGGHECIRDIWTNYYAEVHGIIYVVDVSNEERLEENYETIKKLQQHRGTARKPLLVVLNKRKPTELDDFDFTINADLNAVGSRHGQMIFVTHVNEYKGELNNAKYPPRPVSKRPRRAASPLLTQFCVFVDKIIEHYVFLSEGVNAAELALKLRQQAERDERRIRLMNQDQDMRRNTIAELEGRSISGNGDVRHDTTVDLNTEAQNVEEEPIRAEPEQNDKTPKSESPSVSDTQSPVVDSSRPPASNHSLDVLNEPSVQPVQVPVPPLWPTRTKVTPMNDTSRPHTSSNNENIFTIKRPQSLKASQTAGRERHLARMRRIQEGLRRKAEEIQLQQL